MRLQLARPNGTLVSPEAFNQLFTMHGTTMIFLVVMPTLVGFANYLVPLMIGARDMAFPRLNAMSYWLFPFGGVPPALQPARGRRAVGGLVQLRAAQRDAVLARRRGPTTGSLALLVLGVGSVAGADQLHRHDPHAARARA